MATIEISTSKRKDKDGKQELLLRFKHSNIYAERVKTGLFINEHYLNDIIQDKEPSYKTTLDTSLNEERKYHLGIRSQLKIIESEIFTKFRSAEQLGFEKGWVGEIVFNYVHAEEIELARQKAEEEMRIKQEQEEIKLKAEEEKRRRQEEKTLFEAVDDFIEYAPKRMQDNGKPLSRGTLWQYGQMRRSLAEFAKSCKKKDWQIKEVNKTFYDSYVEFLYGLGYKMNTVGKHIKNLKAAINSLPAQQRNICEFIEYKKCKKLAEDVDNVYLNEEELNTLANIELTEAQDRVRDQFLLLAWTGCRYSDLPQISAINRKGNVLKIEQTKTGATPAIPIFPEVERIFAKYDNGNAMPPVIENQAFNRAIKEICRLAGFMSQESVTHTINGKRVKDFYEKWELVSAHTARRSFATNLYKRGFPTIGIMKLTGHKTEKAFHTYIKVNAEENAEMMMELWNKMSEE